MEERTQQSKQNDGVPCNSVQIEASVVDDSSITASDTIAQAPASEMTNNIVKVSSSKEEVIGHEPIENVEENMADENKNERENDDTYEMNGQEQLTNQPSQLVSRYFHS